MALPNITLTLSNAERVAIQHAIWPTINSLTDRLTVDPFSLDDEEARQLAALARLNERLTIPSN